MTQVGNPNAFPHPPQKNQGHASIYLYDIDITRLLNRGGGLASTRYTPYTLSLVMAYVQPSPTFSPTSEDRAEVCYPREVTYYRNHFVYVFFLNLISGDHISRKC